MAKQSGSNNLDTFSKVIASLATEAVSEIDGIRLPDEKKSRGAVSVYFLPDERVNVECFVIVSLGYAVPKVVSELQESVKTQIEKVTKFKVHAVNVHVMGVAAEQL